ncbi:hypothetical protein Goklo_001589 [Gossypium klotzschianum]|uniref:TATA-box binding protein n=1 Tax=Gossypium klotzschianum TaxID=34286 RepID=A0A7J8W1G3_9ROSI|nr:hypothetical protein [Gossypium klotzschianum]
MRIREPKTTALIFASGKMVCTGAKSEQQSKLAARKLDAKMKAIADIIFVLLVCQNYTKAWFSC